MSDLLFNCPHCQQPVTCDELLAGQELQCPGCRQNFVVPAGGAPPPSRPAPFRQQTPATSNRSSQSRTPLTRANAEATGGVMKWVKIAAILIVLGVGGYFGYIQIGKWQAKLNEASRKEEAKSDGGQLGHIAGVYEVLDATEPGNGGLGGGGGSRYEPAEMSSRSRYGSRAAGPTDDSEAPEKQLPIIAPNWTLDPAAAKIPEGRANGTISGTNFVCDSARLDVAGNAVVLSLRQGTNASPEGEILVYLHPKAGEKIGGGSWSISPEMKGSTVPQVAKRWKPNPKFAATKKSFATGYALKLELGPIEFGELTGRIFIALPDPEQTVVAGIFKADTTLPDTADVRGTLGLDDP